MGILKTGNPAGQNQQDSLEGVTNARGLRAVAACVAIGAIHLR